MDSTESVTDESPRISFSLNLSQNDRISPENRKKEDVADVHCDTDFEFCVVSNKNYRHSFFEETFLSVADEMFADGKILPVDRPNEAQPKTISSHLSLESSKCQSPIRSASYPPSKITSSCSGNVASKSSCHKPPSKWKEIVLQLSNKPNTESRKTSSKILEQDRSGNNVKKQASSPRSFFPFSRSCSATGVRERKGNGLFCSLPFSRSHSTTEAKHKAANSAPCSGNHRSPGSVDGNGRSMVRNLERFSSSSTKAASLYYPRPGKPMVQSNSVGKVRVSPVLNVAACIGMHDVGGSWNGGGGFFGFFPKKEKKEPSVFHSYHSHASTNSKKGA